MALITKTELLNTGFIIDKKYVLIESSIYEDDAYQYILSLVDKEGAIAFVKDLRQIYAQGQFYGSDIWSDDLSFFKKFEIYTDKNELCGFIEAINANSTFKLKGINGINLNVQFGDTVDDKTLLIDYDLESKVNTQKFIFDSTSIYNLEVVEGQITMVKYTPASVKVKQLAPIEYDSTDSPDVNYYTISFTIEVSGTEKLTEFALRSSLDTESSTITYSDFSKSENNYNITVQIPVNTDVTFTISYSDGYDKGTGTYSFKQQWGYACVYSNSEITTENFMSISNKYIVVNSVAKKISINQNTFESGWYACPSKFTPVFTDTSVNIQGGWSKLGGIEIYKENIPYTIYITDNTGLGLVTWSIS